LELFLTQDLDVEAALARMQGRSDVCGEVYLPRGLPTQWLSSPVDFPAAGSDDDDVVGPSGLSRFNEVRFVFRFCNLLF
jgi:hypothetical protein